MTRKKMNMNVSRIVKTTIAVLIIAMMFGSTLGCAFTKTADEEPTTTFELIQTHVPTLTPDPTPRPTITPKQELTYEQKKLLLGVDNDFESLQVGSWVTFEMNFETSNGEIVEGRQACYMISKENNRFEKDVFSITNGEYLFSLALPSNDSTPVFYFYKYLTKSAPALKKLTLYSSLPLTTMGTYYASHGVDYQNFQYLNELADLYQKKPDEVTYASLSKEEIIDIIIRSTPQNEIIPFWTYVPGATIPEELREIY